MSQQKAICYLLVDEELDKPWVFKGPFLAGSHPVDF